MGPRSTIGLDGTDYFDLNFSPLFNTLPLLDGLEQATDFVMSFVVVPSLEVVRSNSGTSRSATGSCGTARATSRRRSSSATTGSSRGTSTSPSGCADGAPRAAAGAVGAPRPLLARPRAGADRRPGRHGRISTPNHAWDVEPDEHHGAEPGDRHRPRAGRADRGRVRRPARRSSSASKRCARRTGASRTGARTTPSTGISGRARPRSAASSTSSRSSASWACRRPSRSTRRSPRRWGGNIDCKGSWRERRSTCRSPSTALFSAGDGHAAQGDGEVSGTAIETPAQARLTLDVDEDFGSSGPSRGSAALADLRDGRASGTGGEDRRRRDGRADGPRARRFRRRRARPRQRRRRPARDAGRERDAGRHAVLRDDAFRV